MMPVACLPHKSLAGSLIPFASCLPVPTPECFAFSFSCLGKWTHLQADCQSRSIGNCSKHCRGHFLLCFFAHTQRLTASVSCRQFPDGFLCPQEPLRAHSQGRQWWGCGCSQPTRCSCQPVTDRTAGINNPASLPLRITEACSTLSLRCCHS